MPKAYMVGRITITDQAKYDEYIKGASVAIAKYGAKMLARGGAYETLEGEGRGRNVLLEFESLDAAREYYNSPEYQGAKAKREGAALADIIIVEGV
ncbi:MAG: DUF1330 domain-containing protein [Microvirga sp.]|nr:DUF1330 domain-containing protein [Microvirga sp.]